MGLGFLGLGLVRIHELNISIQPIQLSFRLNNYLYIIWAQNFIS